MAKGGGGERKVAFVMPYLFNEVSGGAEKQAYLLSKNLALRDFEVYYITSGRGKEVFDGIKVLRILKLPHIFQYIEYPKVIFRLYELDVDIAMTRIRHYYFPISLYGILSFKRSVLFVPENRVPYPFYETEKVLKTKRGIRKVFGVINALILDIFAFLGLFLARTVIVQNEKQGEIVRKFYFKDPKKLPSIFEPLEINVTEKDGICWVGNVREIKRIELFLDIVRNFKGGKFYLVGRIPERYRGLVDGLKNLKVLGELPYSESVRVIAGSKAYINTSKEEGEGFPNTFLESWYYRTLVITFDADPDGLISGGLGVKVRDVDEALKVISELEEDPGKFTGILERAYDYVVKNHLPERVIKLWCEVVGYEDV
jgi:Glycosyltransferase